MFRHSSRPHQKRTPVGLLFACAWLGFCEHQSLADDRSLTDDRLQKIIENVHQHEALYADLDVRLRETYRIGEHAPAVSQDGIEEIIGRDLAIHYVSQDDLFRLEIEGQSRSNTRTPSRNRIRAFDGTTTRLHDQDAVGNIISGPSPDDNAVHPHMLLMRYSFLRIPLSTLLKGDAAIAAHPFGKPNPNLRHQIRYEGEEEFQGLKCHRVSVESVRNADGQATSRREYWLAEDRNFIPVRLVSYNYNASRDVPSGEGIVEEFREISKGVWFPMVAHFAAHDELYLQREGTQRLQWREDYIVEEASLEPKYDLAYFRDVDFPDGTAMYEVENGEIKRSWRQGAPEAPEGPTASEASQWWLLWVNGTVVAVLVAVFLVRRARTAKAASMSK